MTAKTFLWQSVQTIPPLAAAHVHVYAWDLDLSLSPGDWEMLSEEEITRARRFVFPRDRVRYVRAHSGMRRILGWHSGVPPAKISFSTGRYGNPQIEHGQNPGRLQFNLSHSAGVAVLAVAYEYCLGVDVEVVRPIGADVAEHYFSSTELRTLRDLPPEQWPAGFYRCWTSKEALLKGEGLGLNLALDAFDVEVHPGRAPALLDCRLSAGMASDWLLADLKPAVNAVGTLAVRDEAGKFSPDRLGCFSLNG